MEKLIKSTRLQIIFIIVLTFLVYVNSLGNGLVWDDHLFIEKWKEMQSFDIASLLQGSAPEAQGKIYRPIRSVIYAVNYRLWGENPFFYHLQAILIHVGVTVLVFYIVRLILQGVSFAKETPFTAFIAALIFGLHPIHTETIDYISASMETWGTLFFFLSFYLYLMPTRPRLARLASLVFAFLAFFTYEMTLTLPLLIVLYEYYVRGIREVRGIGGIRAIGRVAPYFGIAILYVLSRTFILGLVSRTDYLAYSFYHTMLTMVKVFVHYIFLLFFPLNLSTNHNLVGNFPSSMLPYDSLEPILKQSIFDWDVLLGILGLLGLLGAGWALRKKSALITFGIAWFFISLLPVSYIIPHGGAMAEKYLYIASFGFTLILALLFEQVVRTFMSGQKSKVKSQNNPFDKLRAGNSKLKIFGTITLVISLFYFYLTFQRNTVWKDDISLFSDVVKKSPYNLISNYTLGVLYGEKNDLENATLYYKRAINTAPDFWEARFNLGNIYLNTGNLDLAREEYGKVLQLNPGFEGARANIDLIEQYATESALVRPKPDLSPRHSGEPSPNPLPKGEGEGEGARGGDDTKKYSFSEISFEYPKDWSIREVEKGIVINDKSAEFTIEISLDNKKNTMSANEYIGKKRETHGTLVTQGQAKIPNMDFAYVKVWANHLQFFLFKKDLVTEVLAYPSDSPSREQFDKILGSITVN